MNVDRTTTYIISDANIHNTRELRQFVATHAGTYGLSIFSVHYDPSYHEIIVVTNETHYSQETNDWLEDLVKNKFPNPPVDAVSQVHTDVTDRLFSRSVYGYFPQSTSIDGDAVISSNTSLTRNMYYKNLTVESGVKLNANGWRIVVIETLILNGIISNDGHDASGTNPGIGSSPMHTTFLGSGTTGGRGLTNNGSGVSGDFAPYQCAGGKGGSGGHAIGSFRGGEGGSALPIAPADGGLNILSTMPTAFMGRLLSANYYVMGGTGGGSGGCHRGNASQGRSGAGGGGGGMMIVAAKAIRGDGTISVKGGKGSSASWSGIGIQEPQAIGGGGGGGGGCIILIIQGMLPHTIKFDVSGGDGGEGVFAGSPGKQGESGNTFVLNV
jgi:hypothetical protein